MRFANPYYLYLFFIVPAVYYIKKKLGKNDFLPISSVSFAKLTGIKTINRDAYVLFLKLSALSLFILAAARPQKGITTSEIFSKGIDIILCMDTSTSMRALDFQPRNRFEVAKAAAKEFVKARKNDRIGVVVFSGLSFTQCPLTIDHSAVLEFMDKMQIGMTQIDGTNIGSGILTSVERLRHSKSAGKIIILLTDGRNNMGDVSPITAAQAAAGSGIKIYTIGAALPGRSLYPIDDPIFGTRYVYVQDDLDEGLLREIADITGGKYFRVNNRQGISEIYRQIDKMEKTEIKSQSFTDYYELYHFFLIPGFALFLFSVITDKILFWKIP